MRVLVCGGRRFNDHVLIYDVLGEINERSPVTHVIAGGATGADKWAESWAWMLRLPFVCYPAAWDQYGKAAGPIRNQQMLEMGKPNLVVAFPGGAGTRDMVKRARAAGVEVLEVAHSNGGRA